MKTIFVVIGHGFHVRNLLYSPLFTHLKSRYKVTILVNGDDAEIAASRFNDDHCHVAPVSVMKKFYEDLFMFLRKNVFVHPDWRHSINILHRQAEARRPHLYAMTKVINRFLGASRISRRVWRYIEGLFIQGKEFEDLFKMHRPAAVIAANYGTEPLELRLFRAARRFSVPTIAVVPSWDNLTSKGVMGIQPDHLVVWNEIMQREATLLHDCKPERVHVCGGLQFDRYHAPLGLMTRERFCQERDLDPTAPLLVYGTVTPKYFPYNIDIVDILAKAISTGRIRKDAQLIVRVHPQVVEDPVFGDNLEDYRQLAANYPFIKLSVPKIERWKRLMPPSAEDSLELTNLLYHSAVSIMPASTLAIDAMALGCPVVGAGFDGYGKRAGGISAFDMFGFTHYRNIVELGSLAVATSETHMIEEVNAYLADRNRHHVGRQNALTQQLWRLDGQAWQRVAAVIDGVTGIGSSAT